MTYVWQFLTRKNYTCLNKMNWFWKEIVIELTVYEMFLFSDVKVNYIIQKDQSKVELAQYLHGCAFSPSISTFQTAINRGNFITRPGIDEMKFKSLLGSPLATTLGHMDQERSNLQSTKVIEPDEKKSIDFST